MQFTLASTRHCDEHVYEESNGSDVAQWKRNWAVDDMNWDPIPLHPDPLCVPVWGWVRKPELETHWWAPSPAPSSSLLQDPGFDVHPNEDLSEKKSAAAC